MSRITTTTTYGTHGHRHEAIIDGEDQRNRRDRRVKPEHLHARSNVRSRQGTRSHPVGRALPGVAATTVKLCVSCGTEKQAREFENHAVATDLRRHDGFNITCRACQAIQYSRGYRLDGFVVPDEESEEDSEEEYDEEEESEDDED